MQPIRRMHWEAVARYLHRCETSPKEAKKIFKELSKKETHMSKNIEFKKEVLKALEDAWALIDTPQKWIRGENAAIDGNPCRSDDPKATQHCARGAIYGAVPIHHLCDPWTGGCLEGQAVEHEHVAAVREWAQFHLIDNIPDDPNNEGSIVRYNDAKDRTHDEIKAWFHRAIEAAKAAVAEG